MLEGQTLPLAFHGCPISMKKMQDSYFDIGTLLVIVATLVLFALALFVKGFTRDLLLEAAIFLVSLKLIINAYKNIKATNSLHKKLDQIYKKLEELDSCQQK